MDLGKSLIVLGMVLIALGLLVSFAGKIPWLGNLPGDIYYKGERTTFYFPVATSILISVALSLLLYLMRK